MADANHSRRLNVFERYLTLWVTLCMVVGIALGRLLPGLIDTLRRIEFGGGSQINIPIAILIWLMIYPMMLKVDFASVLNVRRRPTGLFITCFVNWVVKPFSMALLGYLFFRLLFRQPSWQTSTSPASSSSPPRHAPRWSSSGAT